jgi:hypothetical protein
MSHLTFESLARLVDEPPTPAERQHLDACAHCRAGVDEMRRQTTELAALPAMHPPADAWEKIVARMGEPRVLPLQRSRSTVIAARAAAALVIFALGAAAGTALSRNGGSAPTGIVAGNSNGGGASTGTSAGVATISAPRTPDLALARLRIAEMMYTSALLDYAALTSPRPPEDAVARLATLETIVLTTSTALERAPADPLINSYHLAALAERQTLLSQLRRTSETGQWY